MSLATDILARALREPVNLVATPRQRKQTKRGKILTAPKPRAERSEGRALHLARVYGLHHRENGWETTVFCGRDRVRLGTHRTIARAQMAQKLCLYWYNQGHDITAMRNTWVEVPPRRRSELS